MTEPLIDRDALASLMDEVTEQIALGNPYVTHARAAMSYLRQVLTPETLKTYETFVAYDGHLSSEVLSGYDLHRRIFGEDK